MYMYMHVNKTCTVCFGCTALYYMYIYSVPVSPQFNRLDGRRELQLSHRLLLQVIPHYHYTHTGREGEREGGREGGRERGRAGEREGGREGEREGVWGGGEEGKAKFPLFFYSATLA